MDKILLLVSDWNLRQLYHELLHSKNVEILPTENIADASVMLMLNSCTAAIIDADSTFQGEVKVFLNLRSEHAKLSKTKVILLTSKLEFYGSLLRKGDFILDNCNLSVHETAQTIKSFLKLR